MLFRFRGIRPVLRNDIIHIAKSVDCDKIPMQLSKLFKFHIPSVFLQAGLADSKVHGANMGPTWFLLAQDEPHVGSMKFAIRDVLFLLMLRHNQFLHGEIIYWNNRQNIIRVKWRCGCQLDEPQSLSGNRQRNTFVKLLNCCVYEMYNIVFFWK